MAGSHCLGHSSHCLLLPRCHQPVFCNLNVTAAATPRYCSHSAFWTFPIFNQTGSCPGPGRVGLEWLKCPRSEVRVSPCLVAAKAIHGPCKSLCYFPKGSHVPHTQWTKTLPHCTHYLGKTNLCQQKVANPSQECEFLKYFHRKSPEFISNCHLILSSAVCCEEQ